MTTIDIDIQEVSRQFMAEAAEILDAMEDAAIQLEERPGDPELVRSIFRGAHTLKGNASCLAFNETTHLAHALENVLDALVDGSVTADATFVTLVLQMIDGFREALPTLEQGDDKPRPDLRRIADALGEWRLQELASAPADRRGDPTGPGAKKAAGTSRRRALRVDVERLDEMLNLAGELAVARGRLRKASEQADLPVELIEAIAEAERLSHQIQDLVTRVRMVPVGMIFRPFVRTVRDLAARQGKKARLLVEGGDVEVDLSVVEHLHDPLIHMVRNAIDHGIEFPNDRRAAGKPPEGRLTLRARHASGSIVIEVQDDGAGLDEEKILAKARNLGLIEEGASLSKRDIHRLVLEPGFSTASEVTEISGRGVGLDVVRRNVEALHGSIEIESGAGTRFTIRLPLTLAIIDGFAVGVGEETYVMPLDSVVECITMPADYLDVDGLIDLRGEPLPVVQLRSVLGLAPAAPRYAVVVESSTRRIGLAVDRLEGQNQTVIKPLDRWFGGSDGFSGSSILGDGRVALVLDVATLVERLTRRNREAAA